MYILFHKTLQRYFFFVLQPNKMHKIIALVHTSAFLCKLRYILTGYTPLFIFSYTYQPRPTCLRFPWPDQGVSCRVVSFCRASFQNQN